MQLYVPAPSNQHIYNTYHSCNPSSLRGNQKWFSPYHVEKVIRVKNLSRGGYHWIFFIKNVSELNPFTPSSDP